MALVRRKGAALFAQLEDYEDDDIPRVFMDPSKYSNKSDNPTGPKITPLPPVGKEIVAYIESVYQSRGKFPRASTIKKKFDRDITALCKQDSFLLALSNRGIPVPASYLTGSDLLDQYTDKLTVSQVNTVMVLTDFHDSRSRSQKFRSLGINTTTFNGWMKDPVFKQFFETMSLRNFKDGVHIAREGLIKAMDRGEVAAVKYFMELHGEAPEIQNIRSMLARLVEVIQRHVPDQETMLKIEQDFKRVMASNSTTIEGE